MFRSAFVKKSRRKTSYLLSILCQSHLGIPKRICLAICEDNLIGNGKSCEYLPNSVSLGPRAIPGDGGRRESSRGERQGWPAFGSGRGDRGGSGRRDRGGQHMAQVGETGVASIWLR